MTNRLRTARRAFIRWGEAHFAVVVLLLAMVATAAHLVFPLILNAVLSL